MAQQYGNADSLQVFLAGPFGSGGTSVKLAEITLPAGGWKGAEELYWQIISVEGISRSSMVQLHPDMEQLLALRSCGLALTAENEDGAVTVYALGGCPAEDLTLQASIMEVIA